jgi:hypothetical protein
MTTVSLILSISSIIISIFVISENHKRRKKIHNKIIKDVTEKPYLAKMAMKDFPELKEEIEKRTNDHN